MTIPQTAVDASELDDLARNSSIVDHMCIQMSRNCWCGCPCVCAEWTFAFIVLVCLLKRERLLKVPHRIISTQRACRPALSLVCTFCPLGDVTSACEVEHTSEARPHLSFDWHQSITRDGDDHHPPTPCARRDWNSWSDDVLGLSTDYGFIEWCLCPLLFWKYDISVLGIFEWETA